MLDLVLLALGRFPARNLKSPVQEEYQAIPVKKPCADEIPAQQKSALLGLTGECAGLHGSLEPPRIDLT
ncbi:MAG: hypothetical protein ABSF50_05275 [Burkholderiaceae bacterium]